MKLHFHRYTAWSTPVQTYSGNLQQWRVCEVCNHADFKTLAWHKQTPLSEVIHAIKESLK